MYYKYSALKRSDEIRLIELLPSEEFNSAIHLLIHHATLERPHGKIPLEEIRKTLPKDWLAYETVEGKILYCRAKARDDANEGFNTTWTHPDPGFDTSLVDKPSAEDYLDLVASYEALSYVWGPAQPTYTIYVGSTTLQVRENLLSALRHLRNRSSSRILWVDAICIDQESLVERGHQVRSMGDIYKMAKRVIVWLGPELAESKIALQTLDFLGRQIEICTNGVRVNAPGCQQPTWYLYTTLLPYNERTWQAIYALLSRPWFNRLWVWQEAKLANKDLIVHCGRDWTSILIFYKAVEILVSNQKLPLSNLPQLAADSANILQSLPNRPYEIVLPYLSVQDCFDPRDKIYGGLGVAPPNFRTLIKPDYSLTVADVYRQAFVVWAQYTHRLDLLSHCQLGLSQLEKPSWVPDWSVSTQLSHMRYCFQASGISHAQTKFRGSSILDVSAVTYDTVSYVNSKVSYDSEENLSVTSQWMSRIDVESNYITGQNNLDVFVSMICMGTTEEKFPNSSLRTLRQIEGYISLRSLPEEQCLCSTNKHINHVALGSQAFVLHDTKRLYGIRPCQNKYRRYYKHNIRFIQSNNSSSYRRQ